MADKYVNATGLRAVIDWILSAFTKKKDFDALEIGGRNILRGTKFDTISSISDNVGSGVKCDVVNQKDSSSPSGYSLTMTRTDSTTTNGGRYITMHYKLTNGKVYTWNFYAKGSGSWNVGNEQNGQKTITLTSDYVRYNHTFTADNNNYYQFAFYTYTKNASITICGLKLEVGNKPTDWSPAPEDVETAISDVTNDCIKGLSVSDKTITYTKGDGSKGTIATQDTNTWRGIQNNLTSDSTTESLAAAQGKALKALVDGKAASSHTHTKSQITDFPTSLPANGGNADTATKLATARTIALTGSVTGSGTFDGSGNLSIATTTNHTHNYLPLSGGTMTGNIKWTTANSKIPYIGYCTESSDGTFVMSTTGTTYTTGLAIGGSSENLLYKGNTVLDASNYKSYCTPANIGAAASSHTHAKSDITDMPTSLPANGGNADTVDGKHASDIFAHKGLATCGQVSPNTRGCFNVNLTDTSMGWMNVIQFEQGHFLSQLGLPCWLDGSAKDLYIRSKYVGGGTAYDFADWNTGWKKLGIDVVIGTSATTLSYRSEFTKAVVEFWKTTVGSASRTVYDSTLITGLSSSMTAVTPSAISSGQDFVFALGNDASGGIIISGNFTKYKITYFN